MDASSSATISSDSLSLLDPFGGPLVVHFSYPIPFYRCCTIFQLILEGNINDAPSYLSSRLS